MILTARWVEDDLLWNAQYALTRVEVESGGWRLLRDVVDLMYAKHKVPLRARWEVRPW